MPTDWDPWPGKTKATVVIGSWWHARTAARPRPDSSVRRPAGARGERVQGCMDPALAVRSAHGSDPTRRVRIAPGPPAGPPGRPAPGDRPDLRGGPQRAGPRRRDVDPEPAPDLGAGGDGPRAVARARRRVRLAARRAPPRVHPARGAVRAGRLGHDDGGRPGRRAGPLAVGDLAPRRRARPAPPRRATARGGGSAPAVDLADPARPRRSCASSTAAGPISSCRPCGRCRRPSASSSRWASPRWRRARSRAAAD